MWTRFANLCSSYSPQKNHTFNISEHVKSWKQRRAGRQIKKNCHTDRNIDQLPSLVLWSSGTTARLGYLEVIWIVLEKYSMGSEPMSALSCCRMRTLYSLCITASGQNCSINSIYSQEKNPTMQWTMKKHSTAPERGANNTSWLPSTINNSLRLICPPSPLSNTAWMDQHTLAPSPPLQPPS